MKVWIVSDLHLLGNAPGGDLAVRNLAAYICYHAEEGDVLLVLGDLGHGDLGIISCLPLFAAFPGKKLAVLGNHDLWKTGVPAQDRYQLLQDIVLDAWGFHSLDKEPFVYQGVGFVGSIGWYDYSLARLSLSRNDFALKVAPFDDSVGWGDLGQVDWGMSDESVVEWQLQKLRDHLERLGHISRIVVGMHHLPTRKLLVGPDFLVPKGWGYLNAFLGSSRFGQLFSEFSPRIVRVFCGHVHHHKDVFDGGVSYTSLGGDYRRKELLIYDPRTDCGTQLHAF